ncbi:hypothetical protein PENSUB_8403 [Penicillium subrubescens]|uniref:Uncharacterized protein n=1 Tax=Penicillium subrubescens TaxID=1316194 RepID=A0A1Q5TH43_9EURO|nr:hypothetical protein PENSUB_8403 [Penicillium subrubescens]
MSVVAEDPSMTYVKTGLLAKSSVAPPKTEAWWRRAEAWERPFSERDLVE